MQPTTPLLSSPSPPPPPAPCSSARRPWWPRAVARQVVALTRKNASLLVHETYLTAFQVCLPALFVLLILLIASTTGTHHSAKYDAFHPAFSRCNARDVYDRGTLATWRDACVTLVYEPADSARVRAVVARVARAHGLRLGRDVVGVSDAAAWWAQHVGQASAVVVFEDDARLGQYEVWYNASDSRHGRLHQYWGADVERTLALQASLDAAVLAELSGAEQAHVDVDLRFFEALSEDEERTHSSSNLPPGTQELVKDDHDLAVVIGLVPALVSAGVFAAIIHLQAIAAEKESRVISAMKLMGLRESAYWASWTLSQVCVSGCASLLAVGVGHASQLRIFTRCNFFVHWFALWLFMASMGSLTSFMASFMTRPQRINVWSFVVWFCALVMGMFLFNPNIFFRASTNTAVQTIVFFFPWVQYSKVLRDILRGTVSLESAATGNTRALYYSWSDMYATQLDRCDDFYNCCDFQACDEARSSNYALLIMLAEIAVFMTLAWYCGQVFSGDTLGAPRPFYFLLQPSYWGLESREEPVLGDTIARVREQSRREGSIRTLKATKTYPGTTAVRELTLHVAPGEVCVLLGANGSGKSVTIKMISGLVAPTFGEIFVLGKRPGSVQHLIGMCPQHDLLWPALTGREHLHLYGALRGLPLDSLDDMVAAKAAQFGMDELVDMRTASMSGGMKRKLSLALATVGEPPIVILDEPTTGMDPLNKALVMTAVKKLKEGRIVLLTTHSMESADFMADRVAIVHRGRLRAMGTPLFLKNRFGRAGYHIRLLADADKGVPRLQQAVQDLLPGAEIVANSAGHVTVSLPKRAVKHVPDFVRFVRGRHGRVEVDGSEPLVSEWSFSNTTLEEVYLRLCASEERLNDAGAAGVEDDTDEDAASGPPLCLICKVREAQVVNLFTQDGIAVRVPHIVCLACAMGAKEEEHEEEAEEENGDDSDDSPQRAALLPMSYHDEDPDDDGSASGIALGLIDKAGNAESDEEAYRLRAQRSVFQSLREPTRRTGFLKPLRGVMLKNLWLTLRQRKSIVTRLIILMLCVAFAYQGKSGGGASVCPGKWDSTSLPCDEASIAPFLRQYAQDHGQRLTSSDNGVSYNAWGPSDGSESYNIWFTNARTAPTLEQMNPTGLGVGVLDRPGVVSLRDLSAKPKPLRELVHDGLLLINGNSTGPPAACANQGFGDAWYIRGSEAEAKSVLRSLVPDFGVDIRSAEPSLAQLSYRVSLYVEPVKVPFVDRYSTSSRSCSGPYSARTHAYTLPFLVNALDSTIARQVLNRSDAVLEPTLVQLPELQWHAAISDPTATMQFFTFVSMLLWADSVSLLVYEREQNLWLLMRMQGMRPGVYWLGNYAYFLLLQLAWQLIFLGVSVLFENAVIMQASFGLWIAVALVWSHALMGMAFMLAPLFKKRAFATVFAYFLSVAMLLVSGILDDNMPDEWPIGALFIPPVAFVRAASLLSRYGTASGEFNVALGMTFVSGSLALGIGLALAALGTVFSSFEDVVTRLCRLRSGASFSTAAIAPEEDAAFLAAQRASEDETVQRERERIEQDRCDGAAVLVRDLSKTYRAQGGQGAVRAVSHLSLSMERGDCLGLCGVNGSGKTTLLSVVNGGQTVFDGDVFVDGHNVRTDMDAIHSILGVTPQFDVTWRDLTVREHLEFYARIKGTPLRTENATVQQLAEMVELDGDALDMYADNLSGGQRRRLSIAISLIGNPRVWLLDEPSTGLSPEARYQIWRIVHAQKEMGRTIIVTSHSMDEIDALADRIAILDRGCLICLGRQDELKKRYSQGYRLTLNVRQVVTESLAQQLLVFVRAELCRGAEVERSVARSITFRLPKDAEEEVLELFSKMEVNKDRYKAEYGVREWGLKQSSLAEVFVQTVQASQSRMGSLQQGQHSEQVAGTALLLE